MRRDAFPSHADLRSAGDAVLLNLARDVAQELARRAAAAAWVPVECALCGSTDLADTTTLADAQARITCRGCGASWAPGQWASAPINVGMCVDAGVRRDALQSAVALGRSQMEGVLSALRSPPAGEMTAPGQTAERVAATVEPEDPLHAGNETPAA